MLKQGQSNVLAHDPLPGNRKIHPTEKPVALLRQLIETSTVQGEVVLDMFGGSGSTAEAAIQTGRNFILIEKDPAYHEGIIERLSNLGTNSQAKAPFVATDCGICGGSGVFAGENGDVPCSCTKEKFNPLAQLEEEEEA